MARAEHFFPVGEGVAELYANRIGKTAQHEGRGQQVLNKLGIERSSYNLLDRKPIFPGSSLKGAIRTALLDEVNDGHPLSREIKDKKPTQRNQALQESLFKGKFNTDPMRLVSISDARWSIQTDVPGNEIRFAVNRQRKLKEGQRQQQSMAEEKGLYQILECVGALQPRCLSSQLNLHNAQELSGHYADKLPNSDLQWSIQDIAQACNRFYHKLFTQETKAMREMGYLDESWLKQVQTLLSSQLTQKLANNEAFLLRVGRHSGAEALTLEGVRSIKIIGGKKGNDHWESAPKTWWLAASDTDSKGGMMPFGWVLVEIDAETTSFVAQAEMDSFNAYRQQWYEDQQQQQATLNEKLIKQQQIEQARLKAEEQERLQEQAEAEALATMTEEERKLHALSKLLEADQQNNIKQAGSQASNDLAILLQEAAEWDVAVCRQLADLAEAIYNWHGWGPKKKRPNKQAVLDQLRG